MDKVTRLFIYKGGTDVSNAVTLVNGKGNGCGWTQHEIHHNGKRIGWLESGYPMDFIEGYTYIETDAGRAEGKVEIK